MEERLAGVLSWSTEQLVWIVRRGQFLAHIDRDTSGLELFDDFLCARLRDVAAGSHAVATAAADDEECEEGQHRVRNGLHNDSIGPRAGVLEAHRRVLGRRSPRGVEEVAPLVGEMRSRLTAAADPSARLTVASHASEYLGVELRFAR